MTRTKGTVDAPIDLEDDEFYRGELVSARFVKSTKDGYADQIEVEWLLKDGVKVRDWPAVAVGQRQDGTIAKLRQMLNALAEKPKDTELWFDADTLEWGYDLENDDSAAYAKLTPGLTASFSGENRKNGKGISRYKITAYKMLKAKK